MMYMTVYFVSLRNPPFPSDYYHKDLSKCFVSEHQISEVRHEKGKRLMFNISELPLSDDIVGAELRIYQDQSVSKKKQNRQYTISAFQVIRNDGGYWRPTAFILPFILFCLLFQRTGTGIYFFNQHHRSIHWMDKLEYDKIGHDVGRISRF